MTDGGVHVEPELLLGRLRRAGPVDLNVSPLLGEGLERDLAGGRIDIAANQHRVVDSGDEALGVDLAFVDEQVPYVGVVRVRRR